MSVVQLDFFDREDLNGAVIDTITDEDTFFEGFEMRIALRDLGSGLLTVSRQGISAGAPFFIDIARSEAFVRVLVPAISSDYLFGFFLDSRKSQVLSSDESAGLDIVVGGSGPLYYLSRGIFYNERFSASSGFVYDEAADLIRFPEDSTPGDILNAFFTEDANNTEAEFIPALTKDFNTTTDSDGNAWDDTFGEGLDFAVGTHYLQALRITQNASEDLDVVMDLGSPGSPQMLLRAFNRYGRDLTGTTFGAGKVLWKAGINTDPLSGNILTGLEQQGSSTRKPSHVLVRGADNVYQRVTKGGYAAGQFTKAVFLDFPNADSAGPLNQAGLRHIRTWEDRSEGIQLEIHPGFDEAVGHYMPGPDGSNGHFWIGDDITLKTGGDGTHSILDYHYETQRITGIRMVMDEAVRDDTDETAALSWHVVPELNEVFGVDGTLHDGTGICCGPRPPSPPVEAACTRFYFSDNAGALDMSGDTAAGWEDADEISVTFRLYSTPQSSFSTGAFYDSADGILGVTSDVCLMQSVIVLDSTLAAVLAAGGASLRAQMKGSARFGIGIDEGAQDIISQITVRVTQGATTTIRGTALALHNLGSSAGSAKWPASATEKNRVFPPAAAGSTLSAVSGATAGDYLVVELGYRNFNTTSTSGGAVHPRDGSGIDLPEDELETNNANSWIEICTSGSSGDTTSPITLPGDEDVGDSPHFSPIDHSHPHGFLSDDGIHFHDADQTAYDNDSSGLGAGTVQEAIDELAGGAGAALPAVITITTAPEGGWEQVNKPVAVYSATSNRTYFAYITGDDGDIKVGYYDHSAGTTSALFTIDAAFQVDDHAHPTIVLLSDGRLAVFFSEHNGSQQWVRVSTNAEDISAFDAAVNLDAQLTGTAYTYNAVAELTAVTGSPLFMLVRPVAGGVDQTWAYSLNDTGDPESGWDALTSLVAISGRTPYMNMSKTSESRIDFLVVDGHGSTEDDISVYHFYYDGDAGTFHKTDGSAAGTLPLNASEMTEVYDGTGEKTRMGNVGLGADGHPRAVFSVAPTDGDVRVHYARWNGSAWSDVLVADGTERDGSSPFAKGMILDPVAPARVWISRDVGGTFELFEYFTTDGGATFTERQITTSSSEDQFTPHVPDNRSESLPVLWLTGSQTDFENWAAGIMGYLVNLEPAPESGTGAHDHDADYEPLGAVAAHAADPDAHHDAFGPILISDTPSTPLVFADLIQNEAQDDLVYADP